MSSSTSTRAAPRPPRSRCAAPPDGRAAFTGQIRVNGSHVRITGLDFRGLGAVASFAPKTYHLGVDGDDVVLSDLEITSPKGTCVDVGQIDAYGGTPGPRADGFVLEHSRVHGCGLANELTRVGLRRPRDLPQAHARRRLSDLYVHDNVNRGIQLWPAATGTLIDARHARRQRLEPQPRLLRAAGYASTDTIVRRSVIANSQPAFVLGLRRAAGRHRQRRRQLPRGQPRPRQPHRRRLRVPVQPDAATSRAPGSPSRTTASSARPTSDRAAGDLRQAAGVAVRGLRRDRLACPRRPRPRTSPTRWTPDPVEPDPTDASPAGDAAPDDATPTPPAPTTSPSSTSARASPAPSRPRLAARAARAPAACSSSPLRTAAACGRASSRRAPAACACALPPPAARRALAARTVTVRRRAATRHAARALDAASSCA